MWDITIIMSDSEANNFQFQTAEKFVVMTDMIGSRALDHSDASEKAVNLLEHVNRNFHSEIFLPFQAYKGYDEIVGILNSIEHLGPLLIDIAIMLHPFATRIVAVHGNVHYQMSPSDGSIWNSGKQGAVEFVTMGGEAFVMATDITDTLKKNGRIFQFHGRRELLDRSLSLIIEGMLHEIQTWSNVQRNAVRLYRKIKNQAEVAKQLGISQQRVSKIFQQIRYSRFDFKETEINAIFRGYH
jgi:hypothetical protein